MNPEVVKRHAAPVPRYTSYPTAPHFTSAVDASTYAGWLAELPEASQASLYIHIPFCQSLCWYCGCNTKETRRYEPVKAYLGTLEQEISNVARRLPKDHVVTSLHWGGGSPNILVAADIVRLAEATRHAYNVAADADFAVEIDPRVLTPDQVAAFAAAGVNRASFGVQDFDPVVQKAINREQGYETTRDAIARFRDAGISSINIDLVYGLPHQTRASLSETVKQVLTLNPDRVAIFGYAHLPERMKHQRLIDDATVPGPVERFGQAQRAARLLKSAGYVAVGLDHFALPSDPLAQNDVHRNFQGYTVDTAETLIGLGSSAIGQLPQGYVQNATTTGEYQARIRDKELATVRGFALSNEDRMRAAVISQLMCEQKFSASDLRRDFGADAESVIGEAEAVLEADHDGFLQQTADGFRLTEGGRPFVRTICACFDAYFGQAPARHALAV